MLNVTLEGDKELIAKLDAMPNTVKAELYKEVTGLALKLEAHVKNDKLSGDVLHVRTGALRRSIFNEVSQSGDSVTGKVASSGDVKYAAIHEFGGTINVPEIVPVNAQALHFTIGGADVFAMHARAHTVTMPERSFLRSSLADMKQEILDGMEGAVKRGVQI